MNDDISLPLIDLSGTPDPHRAALRWMESEFVKPFGELTGRLFDIALIKLADELHYFFMRCHHIIMDGWSFFLFFHRLAEIYR